MVPKLSKDLFEPQEILLSFARSSGSGGQNVNKVNSKVHLNWAIDKNQSLEKAIKDRFKAKFKSRTLADGTVLMTSDKFRDQHRNIEDCFDKLLELIEEVRFPPKSRKKTKPTRGSTHRRLESKERHSRKKQDRVWKGE